MKVNPETQSVHEELKDIKGVIRIRKSKKDKQHSAQKDKQRSLLFKRSFHNNHRSYENTQFSK
jgi:hypothetical protein